MATPSSLGVDEGTSKQLATYGITESGSKELARTVLNTGEGVEISPLTDTQLRATALPVTVSGVATSAKQDTGNSSLASIDEKVVLPASLGQKTKANSLPVVLASDQDALPVTGTFYQATQPVSGNLGADLRVGGSAVTTSNPVPIAPPASGALPVSGTVSANATLSSETTKVIGTVNISAGQTMAVTNAGTFATQPTIQAGTALIGKVSASNETNTVYNGTTALTPKFAKIDISASADIVALVSSKSIRIMSMFLIASADCTLKFQSNASTDLQGAMTLKAGSGFVLGENITGWFQTASGEKLNAVVSGTTQISGSLTYIEV